MISNQLLHYKKVQIHITTFKAELHEKVDYGSCEGYTNGNNMMTEKIKTEARKDFNVFETNTKLIQTSHTDITQGLNLLNEVLTVFQSKKRIPVDKENGKTSTFKDACTTTEATKSYDLKPKLTVSRVCQYSIEEDKRTNENRNFRIVHCFQPVYIRKSDNSINLIKQKSSSIPQMKIEELKNSLKEKVKSKDTIEEVNRMFATVKRNEPYEFLDDANRPIVRSGPRILPVVKTNDYEDINNELEKNIDFKNSRRCCNTNNHQMSSGDSIRRECVCNKKNVENNCEKCIYTLCSHRQKYQRKQQVCECCNRIINNKNKCKHKINGDLEDEGDSF
ncbi:uncharacterized protein ACR2FA_010731 [Aphomia sociella]